MAPKIEEIPLTEITFRSEDFRPPNWNVIYYLAEDMMNRGQMTAVLVSRKDGNGVYRLLAGLRRLLAVKESGLQTIRAIVCDEKDTREILTIHSRDERARYL